MLSSLLTGSKRFMNSGNFKNKKMTKISSLYNIILKCYGNVTSILPFGYALPPVHIYYDVTKDCNLNCSFCISRHLKQYNTINDISDNNSMLVFKSLIKQLPKFSLLSFTGGEPLMSPKFLDIAKCASTSHRTSLITNGTLISDTVAKDLVKIGAATLISKGLIAIDVSLHGNREIHNLSVGNNAAYDLATEGIRRVIYYKKRERKKYPIVNLRCIINPHNYTLLKDMLEVGKELGVDIYTFSLLSCIGSQFLSEGFRECIDSDVLKDELNGLFEKARECKLEIWFSPSELPIFEIVRYYSKKTNLSQYRCVFPWSRAVVSFNGDFLICRRYLIGNLKQQRFIKLWNNISSRKFRLHLKRSILTEDCLGCCGMIFTGKG